jgi:hypothetical protein
MEQMSETTLRVWRVLSWASVVILLGIGIWWMFDLPTVGKGGLFLAVGATLMPLFWEKIGVAGKMSWIAMLFLLLGVEYRAIDKEHHDNDIAQQKALKAIGDGFSGVVTDQRNGFASLIQQSEAAFTRTTEQASAQFDATMAKAQENLNHMTGGKTYPTISPIFIPVENTTNTFRLVMLAIGDSPLFDVSVTVTKLPFTKTINVTDFLSGKDTTWQPVFSAPSFTANRSQLISSVAASEDGQTDFSITTMARNGVFHELLHIRKIRAELTTEGNSLISPWECCYEITKEAQRNKRTYQVSVTKIPWQKFFLANVQLAPQNPK